MKKNKIIFWIATAIIILWEGIMPLSTSLFMPEYVTVGTRPLGYPDYFAYTLIIFKVFGVLAIAYPKAPAKLKEWAYAGLTFNLIYAFISHVCVDKNIGFMLMPLVFLGILALSYFYKDKLTSV
ncbi:DoxX family protein [Pedobacter sp. MC2016-14]|uniref:DoxX family protein n=1 Tax=Pedobacter sp. MC2016-14 TaxID=2897327 RepID=UPI001E38AC57|nr:DoxX family protein [Pedobacter sp. MC2016-14]MCD0488896.1 DoxX family protein [Pedobacter sp. MC2016-14]